MIAGCQALRTDAAAQATGRAATLWFITVGATNELVVLTAIADPEAFPAALSRAEKAVATFKAPSPAPNGTRTTVPASR
jgi:hypothetical protein